MTAAAVAQYTTLFHHNNALATFQFRIGDWRRSLEMAKVYQQTKFRQVNSVHGWDIKFLFGKN